MSRWYVVVRFIKNFISTFHKIFFLRLTILFLMYVDTDNDTEVLCFNIHLKTLL